MMMMMIVLKGEATIAITISFAMMEIKNNMVEWIFQPSKIKKSLNLSNSCT
jgi:hypothetical protein